MKINCEIFRLHWNVTNWWYFEISWNGVPGPEKREVEGWASCWLALGTWWRCLSLCPLFLEQWCHRQSWARNFFNVSEQSTNQVVRMLDLHNLATFRIFLNQGINQVVIEQLTHCKNLTKFRMRTSISWWLH